MSYISVIRGTLSVLSLYFASFTGAVILLPPVLPLLFYKHEWARWYLDLMLSFWKLYAVSLYELVFGVKLIVTGDITVPDEGTLVIMNHRTRMDWLYLFLFELRYGSIMRGKIILKKELKHIPGAGWAMQLGMFVFLIRKWEKDKNILSSVIAYFSRLKYRPQMLLFPEGTDFAANTKARSDSYARKNNLPEYHYCLHPRTTGFTYMVAEMSNANVLDSVLDMTVGYPVNIPHNELDMLKGHLPEQIHLNVKRYPFKSLPSDEDGLRDWCLDLWKHKEERLRKFYEEDRRFSAVYTESNGTCITCLLCFSLVFWSVFNVMFLITLFYSPLFRWYVLVISVGMFTIDFMNDGFEMVQTRLYV